MLNVPLTVKRRFSNGQIETVGQLAEDRSGVFFQYDQQYLTQHSTSLSPFNVRTNSALQKAPQQPHFGLHGIFADSLPDGWGLYLMDRIFRQQGYVPSQITALERLAFVGDRCLGALFYEPTLDIEQHQNNQDIELLTLGNEAIQEFEGTESHLIEHLMNAGGSGGARPKLNVTQLSNGKYTTNQFTPGKQFIIKLTSEKFALKHAESLIEYIYLNIANSVNIEVPEFELLEAGNSRFWLKQNRFDCVGENGRFHMLSACGMLDASYREPSLDYIDLIKATRILCGVKEAQKITKRALFNYLLCNQDDHSKNFSFLCDDSDQWQISPAYDLVYTPSSYGEHMTAFNGNGNLITKQTLEIMAGQAGYSNAIPLKHMMEEIHTASEGFTIQAKSLGIPKSLIKEITQRIAANWQAFNTM